ncbi:unnamed protein product [Callosobruchus maculatus]|uniref:DUF1187 family protein n=1 Tax=Callosobruchus maculatus TaxID=64391 RepID=A0A653BYL8_CALMS|nr:unnamed protein product [Callosobruchus maculatus]
MYRITAVIHKAGGTPVLWTYYSARRLTQTQCENMLSRDKEAGKSQGFRARLTEFCCEKAENKARVIQAATQPDPMDVTGGAAAEMVSRS